MTCETLRLCYLTPSPLLPGEEEWEVFILSVCIILIFSSNLYCISREVFREENIIINHNFKASNSRLNAIDLMTGLSISLLYTERSALNIFHHFRYLTHPSDLMIEKKLATKMCYSS